MNAISIVSPLIKEMAKSPSFKENGCIKTQLNMIIVLTASNENATGFENKVCAAERGCSTRFFEFLEALISLNDGECLAIALSDSGSKNDNFEHRWLLIKSNDAIHCVQAFRRVDLQLNIPISISVIDLQAHGQAISDFVTNHNDGDVSEKYKALLLSSGLAAEDKHFPVVLGVPVVTFQVMKCAPCTDITRASMGIVKELMRPKA